MPNCHERVSALTVLQDYLDVMHRLIAPVMPITAEEVCHLYPTIQGAGTTVFLFSEKLFNLTVCGLSPCFTMLPVCVCGSCCVSRVADVFVHLLG